MSLIKQHIKKYILTISNENYSCGRSICHCLTTLDLTNINDYDIYKKCYKTWLDFNEINENLKIK
jgi:hypothetical protein